MDENIFADSFWLNEFTFSKYHHIDNRHGAKVHYVAYMKEGYVVFKLSDRTVTVTKGEFLFIPKGCCYESMWYGDPVVNFYSFGFMHSPVGVDAFSIQAIEATDEAVALCEKVKTGRKVDSLSVGYLYQLFGMLLPKMMEYKPSSKELLVKKAIKYMRNNPTFSIADVAKHCAVSESGLYASFRRVINKTPIETKNEILAEKVMGLLTTTDMTLDVICEALRFSSVSYMRRVFRNRYNMTPKEARKESITKPI